MGTIYSIGICEFRSEPSDKECLEAIWSQGRACKKCDFNCYRSGWLKLAVDADNRKRVNSKHNPSQGRGEDLS